MTVVCRGKHHFGRPAPASSQKKASTFLATMTAVSLRAVQFVARRLQRFAVTSNHKDGEKSLMLSACVALTASICVYETLKSRQQPKPNSKELGRNSEDHFAFRSSYLLNLPFLHTNRSQCDLLLDVEHDEVDDVSFLSGYSEPEKFFQCLEYHRSLLPDYVRRWQEVKERSTESSAWPRNVPREEEIKSLEMDLRFCKRSPNFRDAVKTCQDTQFRIASYYLNKKDPEDQRKGFRMIKELAEHGHPDGMCYYGIILNEGKVAGTEAHPNQAVVWWRRCTDFHRHIQANYELAVALYTGEGVAENPKLAVKLFRRAAHLGHAGAAYMLGECLLDGVGSERDRANALEWLVTAAELGHQLARKRVLVILQQDYEKLDAGQDNMERRDEALKWVSSANEEKVRDVNLERRFTIGGGSWNPKISARRKTKVEESRDKTDVNVK